MELDEIPAGAVIFPVKGIVFGAKMEIGFAIVDGDTIVIRVTDEISKEALNRGSIGSILLVPEKP